MTIKELFQQMDEYFDLSKKKQRKKHEKLLTLMASLEEKKLKLKRKLRNESRKDKKSKKVYNLCKEFKAINRMLKKARKRAKVLQDEQQN